MSNTVLSGPFNLHRKRLLLSMHYRASLVVHLVRNLPAMLETWVQSLGWEDPLETERLPTAAFWPGEFHGQSSPRGAKELDRTERLSQIIKLKHNCWCYCLATQLCPILYDPMDCLPGSMGFLVHGISQARILEWVPISFSRGIFPTQGSNLHLLFGRFSTTEPPGKSKAQLTTC